MEHLWVGVGGFLGANARYILSGWVAERWGSSFPWATLLINISGSLAIGVILTLLTEKLTADPAWRLLLVVGFLGGYTAFSSYSFEAPPCSGKASGSRPWATSSRATGSGWRRPSRGWS